MKYRLSLLVLSSYLSVVAFAKGDQWIGIAGLKSVQPIAVIDGNRFSSVLESMEDKGVPALTKISELPSEWLGGRKSVPLNWVIKRDDGRQVEVKAKGIERVYCTEHELCYQLVFAPADKSSMQSIAVSGISSAGAYSISKVTDANSDVMKWAKALLNEKERARPAEQWQKMAKSPEEYKLTVPSPEAREKEKSALTIYSPQPKDAEFPSILLISRNYVLEVHEGNQLKGQTRMLTMASGLMVWFVKKGTEFKSLKVTELVTAADTYGGVGVGGNALGYWTSGKDKYMLTGEDESYSTGLYTIRKFAIDGTISDPVLTRRF